MVTRPTHFSLHIAIGIWVVVVWPACGDGGPAATECAARPSAQPLYNASPGSTYLGADEAHASGPRCNES